MQKQYTKKRPTREVAYRSIAVVGLGYVGLPLALESAKSGMGVVGIDVNRQKISDLKRGQMPFNDTELSESLARAERFTPTTSFKRVVSADAIIVCVPTPVTETHEPDLSLLIEACHSIGFYLREGALVVIESTIYPGVTAGVVRRALERSSGLVAGEDFSLAHCPERINPGDPYWSVANIPRVVGGIDTLSAFKAARLYRRLLPGVPIRIMRSLEEAETVKMIENSFRDLNIAFVNELATAFESMGIDIVDVLDGAATKPFGFLAHYPGCGVGGHCIPVDPHYLMAIARANGKELSLLARARAINEDMPRRTVERTYALMDELGLDSKETPVAVLGLAYKGNIDDCRESPAFEIIKHLEESSPAIRVYDPYVPAHSNCLSLEEAIEKTPVVVLATDHQEFIETLTPAFCKARGIRLIVDGRNCLDHNAFGAQESVRYVGIGRT